MVKLAVDSEKCVKCGTCSDIMCGRNHRTGRCAPCFQGECLILYDMWAM